MYISQFFTRYDETITQSLNIDPLGITMIWSRLGQRIFSSRVSSISNDVRNYTVSLLHHYVLKLLVENEPSLSTPLQKLYGKVDSLAFKQACLIYLENIFVFSILDAENSQNFEVDTRGILGSSKARTKMEQNPSLFFTKESRGQLLVRQLTLGVSGRYKTPFLDMKFFDKEFCYHQPESVKQWQETHEFMKSNEDLGQLAKYLVEHLTELMEINDACPHIDWKEISEDIKSSYTKCFATSAIVGKQSKDFWLRITGLNQNAAGSLYQAITNSNEESPTIQDYFEQAISDTTLSKDDKNKLENVCAVEPLLAECDFLFTVLMSQATQTKKAVYQTYKKHGRDVSSIISLAADLQHHHPDITELFNGIAAKRYSQLLDFASGFNGENNQINMDTLVHKLLQYHQTIMNQRGQMAWVEENKEGVYRCNIKQRALVERPYKSWNNRYYIDQFKNLIQGLEGINLKGKPND
ncbi:MAG TPA: hypothetical protein DEV59_11605 [Proteus sp.]|nr:hypothetical protein [Proteus sp. (in: enterobacteria)]